MTPALIAALLISSQASSPVPQVPHHWQNVPIVAGGFVTGIVTHPRARDVVYSRTDIGGAYRLDPHTRTWIPLQDWLPRSRWNWYGVESIALDPQDPDRVYLAVGKYTNEWGDNGAIFRSTDRGNTWQVTPLPFKNGGNDPGRSIGERLAVDPKDGRVLFFGTRHEGLWRSEDHGASWSRVESFPIPRGLHGVGVGWVLFDPTEVGPGPTQHILAAPAIPGVPIHRSRDGGRTWHPVPGAPSLIPHQGAWAQDGTLYVTTTNYPGPNGVTDGGVYKMAPDGRWTEITPVQPTPEQTFGYAGVSLDRSNPGTLIVSTLCKWGADTIFRSRDGGRTWISLAENSVRDASPAPYLKWNRDEADFGHWIGDCEIDPFNPDRVWYVTGATIWETTEVSRADRGETTRWFVGAMGIEETAVIDLASPPRGVHVFSGLGDIGGFPHASFTDAFSGGMLRYPMLTNTESVDFAELKPEVFVRVGRTRGGTHHGGYSLDGGFTWTPLAHDPPGSTVGAGNVAITADGTSVVWAPERALPHWTTDWGHTWTLSAGLPAGSRVVADRVDPQVMYAHHNNSGVLYISRDAGASFTRQGVLPVGELGRMRAVFGQRGHLWIPSSTGLYRSTNGGRSFVRSGRLTSAESVSFGKAAPGARYPTLFVIGRVGEVEGVFRSTDVARSWVQVNCERTGFGVMMHVCGDPKVFGRVYIGTNGRGVLMANPVE